MELKVISFPTAMLKPRIASAMEYALLLTLAGAVAATLIITLIVFLGGNFGTVTRLIKGLLP
jgi:hypothetical protein